MRDSFWNPILVCLLVMFVTLLLFAFADATKSTALPLQNRNIGVDRQLAAPPSTRHTASSAYGLPTFSGWSDSASLPTAVKLQTSTASVQEGQSRHIISDLFAMLLLTTAIQIFRFWYKGGIGRD